MKASLLVLFLLLSAAHGAPGADSFELAPIAPEDTKIVYYSGGQALNLTADPLRDLTGIPEGKWKMRWFAEARVGEDDNNAIAMTTLLAGDGDTIFWIVDRNRNRDLSDDIRVGAKLVQGQGTLPPQEFKITMGGKEIDHKAKLMIYLYGDVSYQYLNTDYYMMGRITLDGKELDAALIDGNGNGTFNDVVTFAQKVTGRNGEDVEIRDSLRSTQFLTLWQPRFLVEDGKGRVLVKGFFEAG
ncbi:MAG: hypothetical protein ACYTG7_15370 [Planctomycetota bacterium]